MRVGNGVMRRVNRKKLLRVPSNCPKPLKHFKMSNKGSVHAGHGCPCQ